VISESWEDVFAVFDAAVATSGVERDALLARECGDDAWLRGEVESLLAEVWRALPCHMTRSRPVSNRVISSG
jgi:hypothetical protein